MQFNDLLRVQGFDPTHVLVVRHRPKEPRLREALPILAVEEPRLFNAYQRLQNPKVEKAYTRAKYVASFVGVDAGKATFVGLYEIGKSRPLTKEQFWRIPENLRLRDTYGMTGFTGERPQALWFDLNRLDFYQDWLGRLTIRWSGLERSWWRWANRNSFPVESIYDQSQLENDIPAWDELNLSWAQLHVIPRRWRTALQQWRGVYYIFDVSDRAAYVGSAYGSENLFGRWMSYAKSGHGGNRLMRGRNPANFRFSILRLLNHDEDKTEVIRIENAWKVRLHTREFGLNKN
jgi:hypothetical protein